MDWKMFFSTFALIFLAELGDKTQLTALARSASGGKWVVFFAASLALVCSTLVAVLFGSVIRKYVPEQYIKITAGSLFLIFGTLTLFSAFRGAEKAPAPVVEGTPAPWVYKLAAGFEESAARDYEKLAEKSSGLVAELFLTLAAEEKEHLDKLKAGIAHEEPEVDHSRFSQLFHDVAEDDKPLLHHAIRHEKATADFYEEIARQISVPGLKKLFAQLAREEQSNADRLEKLI
ncbi:MAG: TMEM165/GDT1 family protein [Spirochaetales bacterium]|nr:TMEM165/GDT1 family protein [Spirochaetales bacterium]